ncbi:unnamed protein product [Dovyalis caffra]|uniref:Uncharacterized protein n=1 Tax=Dovyalis caffra TaxID=77055 RepID=A0AAV1R955_9ROSI|nr:unnamed protein product [Dovyalis caffra]
MATTEELQFLETRKRLKQQIRKQSYSHHLSKLSGSDQISYGSFFGPSQPTIAPRVIQESNLFSVQTQIPALRAVSSDTIVSTMDKWMKVQRLRETRDYSFLFSDNNNLTLPIRTAATPAQVVSVPLTKQHAGSDNKKGLKQLSVASSKPLTNKRVIEKIPSHVSLKHHCTEKRRPVVKAVHSTKKLAGTNNSKGLQRPNDAAVKPNQPVQSISKPVEMTNKRVREKISSAVSNSQDHRPKKRRHVVKSHCSDGYEAEKALLMIRTMFNTKRFAGRDDSDIKMEASFGDIMKEEKRSERLGREEDREQLRLLEEEAKRQRLRT